MIVKSWLELSELLNRVMAVVTLAFFAFIVWIIYMADTGQNSVFFDVVRAIPYGDKLGHFCIFGVLTLGANMALNFRVLACYRLYLGTVLVSAFALLEELSQFFMVNRTLDIMDLLADALGIACFSVLSYVVAKRLALSRR